MDMKECYEQMEGSYADVSMRLPSLKLIEKFLGKFLEDQSFETLRVQIERGDREEAFRAAHTLKGICANLGFTKLLDATSRLTEELRSKTDSVSEDAVRLFGEVQQDYAITVDAIRSYFGEA